MTQRLLTPSKVTAWLDCEHFLTLTHRVEDKVMERPHGGISAFGTLLMDKGLEHERDCLAELRSQGKSVLEVAGRNPKEPFEKWTARVAGALEGDHDVIYQLPMVHDGIRGVADFLMRAETEDGRVTWEPVDAKLSRADAKPGHVLQLCFYAEAIEAATGVQPEELHVWLGSGRWESIRTQEVRPYWTRLRGQLVKLLDADPGESQTTPTPCTHCAFCEFAIVCDEEWRARDALHYVADIRTSQVEALEAAGVETVADLATRTAEVPGVAADRLERLRAQAALQLTTRESEGIPAFRPIEPAVSPPWGHGYRLLPEPSDGDVFLDYEGHPFWRADTGLLFLFGLIVRNDDGTWEYVGKWAHSPLEEADAALWLVDFMTQRLAAHPDMHVYHYNHTERSALEEVFRKHDLPETGLASLIARGTLVDLLPVVRNAFQVGVESYGLKHLEVLSGFHRDEGIGKGSGAVLEYETFMANVTADERSGLTHEDVAELESIRAYNDDDVRATLALRDWLVDQRPDDAGDWRAATLEDQALELEVDELVSGLQSFEPGTPEHLLGDVLMYWRREWWTYKAQRLAKIAGDSPDLLDDPDVVVGMVPIGQVERLGKNGKPLKYPGYRFSCPPQLMPKDTASVMYLTEEGATVFADLAGNDSDAGTVDLVWKEAAEEAGVLPAAVVVNDHFHAGVKVEALTALAKAVLDSGAVNLRTAAGAILRGDRPEFLNGTATTDGFVDDLDAMSDWADSLDQSYLAIQGPPGTGKTYRGARIAYHLMKQGKRVGLTAMSHAAIDNLLDEIVRVCDEQADEGFLRAIRKVTQVSNEDRNGVTQTKDGAACVNGDYNLAAGTTWLFGREDMRGLPVDVLIVDEAGQLGLADALASAVAAKNVLLMGDPLQLPQVSLAVHPGGSGASVLEHILGEDRTLPDDRGVFLPESRRMHPEICSFISDVIYEGRLTSHENCGNLETSKGTGLRWLRAEHDGCGTSSPAEAQLIVEHILGLLDTPWTRHGGSSRALVASDFMVVAPYNDQVDLLRATMDADPRTVDVQVGTVDKFQGREAPVVFYSMTASSVDDAPRGGGFLFSRNRFNVAISRAQCLAYLVCTEALVDSRARTIEDMRLIATLCAFVERAEEIAPA